MWDLGRVLSGSRAFLALFAILAAQPASATLTPAEETGLNLGTDTNYGFVDLGSTTLGWNSGPIAGNVLFGQGLTANLSGGNNGGLTNGGVLYYDNTTTISGSLQNPVTEALVPTTSTLAALTSAQNVSAYAASLTATQTFGNITSATTITGNGGLNVIDVSNIHNAPLTLNGTANDYFIINVSGQIQTNQAMTLEGGVLASHVLFNLTGTGTVLQTSGGDQLYGTFLATDGGQFQFSELNLTGALIDTDGNVQFVSGSEIGTVDPFSVPTPVPEPSTLSLLGFALFGLAFTAGRVTHGHS